MGSLQLTRFPSPAQWDGRYSTLQEHARRWPRFNPRSEEGFLSLPDLAAFFGTETRHHMLDADYLSAWYPRRAAERRAFL